MFALTLAATLFVSWPVLHLAPIAAILGFLAAAAPLAFCSGRPAKPANVERLRRRLVRVDRQQQRMLMAARGRTPRSQAPEDGPDRAICARKGSAISADS